jgi:uncharacterized protein (TIGR00251 family)
VQLSIKVQPRASRNEAGGLVGNELRVRVTSPPVDDAANQAVVELLADALECSRGAVRIVRGRTSRHKVVEISGVAPAQVELTFRGA